jgi:hypothetical protein
MNHLPRSGQDENLQIGVTHNSGIYNIIYKQIDRYSGDVPVMALLIEYT